MSLADAATALDDLANGQLPSQRNVLLGLNALDTALLQGGCEQALYDGAAALELFVAAGGMANRSTEGRAGWQPRFAEPCRWLSLLQPPYRMGSDHGRALKAERFQGLAEVPSELEWFANIDNKSTRRAYENALQDFIRFNGSGSQESFGSLRARTDRLA